MTDPQEPGQLVLRFDDLDDVDGHVQKMLKAKAKKARAKKAVTTAETKLHATAEWEKAAEARRKLLDATNAYTELRKDLVDGLEHRLQPEAANAPAEEKPPLRAHA